MGVELRLFQYPKCRTDVKTVTHISHLTSRVVLGFSLCWRVRARILPLIGKILGMDENNRFIGPTPIHS
jgi:hypothetical protein